MVVGAANAAAVDVLVVLVVTVLVQSKLSPQEQSEDYLMSNTFIILICYYHLVSVIRQVSLCT